MQEKCPPSLDEANNLPVRIYVLIDFDHTLAQQKDETYIAGINNVIKYMPPLTEDHQNLVDDLISAGNFDHDSIRELYSSIFGADKTEEIMKIHMSGEDSKRPNMCEFLEGVEAFLRFVISTPTVTPIILSNASRDYKIKDLLHQDFSEIPIYNNAHKPDTAVALKALQENGYVKDHDVGIIWGDIPSHEGALAKKLGFLHIRSLPDISSGLPTTEGRFGEFTTKNATEFQTYIEELSSTIAKGVVSQLPLPNHATIREAITPLTPYGAHR